MLPLATVQEIRRLLDEGQLSQRKIAAQLGVSRGTVGAIASGRRGMFGREPDTDHPDLCSLDLPPSAAPPVAPWSTNPASSAARESFKSASKRLRDWLYARGMGSAGWREGECRSLGSKGAG